MKRRTVATNWKVNLRTLAHFSSGYFFAAIDITINHVNTVPERELVAWFGRGSPLQRLVLCLFMAAVCTNLCRLIESNRNQHSLRATRWQCCQLITIQLIRRMVERVCVECDLVTVGWSRDSQWLISRDCDPKGLQICRLAFVGRALISQLYRYLAADSNLWTTGVNPRWVAANESGVVLPLWAIRWWTHEL